MGRYAQAHRRGADRGDKLVTTVQLFVDYGTGIFWDFQGPIPAQWFIETSGSVVIGIWIEATTVDGAVLAWNGTDDEQFYRVTPVDVDLNPVGQTSNVVQYFTVPP